MRNIDREMILKVAGPIVGLLLLINTGILAAPHLLTPQYTIGEVQQQIEYEDDLNPISFDTHDGLIYTEQGTDLIVYDEDKEVQWAYDLTSLPSIHSNNETFSFSTATNTKLLSATDEGIYLFYVKAVDDKYIYTLTLLDEGGIVDEWEIKSHNNLTDIRTDANGTTQEIVYNNFRYKVNINTATDDRLLTIMDIERLARVSTNSASANPVCVGSVYLIDDTTELLYNQSLRKERYSRCRIVSQPESFVFDGDLYFTFYTGGNSSFHHRYLPETKTFEPYTAIKDRIEEILEQEDQYQYMGFFTTEKQIYYLIGWKLRSFIGEQRGQRVLAIFNNEGLVSNLGLEPYIPDNLDNRTVTQFRSLYDFRDRIGIGGVPILNQIDVIEQGPNQYLFAIRMETYSQYINNFLIQFSPTQNEERLTVNMIDENDMENTETTQYWISLGRIENNIIFNTLNFGENDTQSVLKWNQIQAQNIPATIEQTSPWLKNVIPSIVIIGIVVLIQVFRHRNKAGHDLYPTEKSS